MGRTKIAQQLFLTPSLSLISFFYTYPFLSSLSRDHPFPNTPYPLILLSLSLSPIPLTHYTFFHLYVFLLTLSYPFHNNFFLHLPFSLSHCRCTFLLPLLAVAQYYPCPHTHTIADQQLHYAPPFASTHVPFMEQPHVHGLHHCLSH